MGKKWKTMLEQIFLRGQVRLQRLAEQKDSGDSHVITVIAMCVIGVALVLVLSTALKPVIISLCGSMEEKITSMFTGL